MSALFVQLVAPPLLFCVVWVASYNAFKGLVRV